MYYYYLWARLLDCGTGSATRPSPPPLAPPPCNKEFFCSPSLEVEVEISHFFFFEQPPDSKRRQIETGKARPKREFQRRRARQISFACVPSVDPLLWCVHLKGADQVVHKQRLVLRSGSGTRDRRENIHSSGDHRAAATDRTTPKQRITIGCVRLSLSYRIVIPVPFILLLSRGEHSTDGGGAERTDTTPRAPTLKIGGGASGAREGESE